MTLKIYDATEVDFSFAGIPITGGFDDGEFIRIERETEKFQDQVGTDGEVVRTSTKDNRATITLILMQTAEANEVLRGLVNADDATPGGSGVGALQIDSKRNDGGVLHEASRAWIQTPPDHAYDREATSREWRFRCDNLRDR